MRFTRANLIGASLIATAIALLSLAPSFAAVVPTVKNYFAACAGANCDNVFTIGGTWKVGTTAISSTAAELNKLAGVVAGTVSASKAIVVDANRHIDVLGLPTSGLKIGASGSETAVTSTGAELNTVAGVTAGTAAASKAVVLDANVAVSGLKIPFGGATTTTAGNPAAGLVDSTSTASGTVQSTEYTLNSVTVKASAFNAATRGLQCVTWGTSAANANAKNYKVYFGATAIVTLTGTTDTSKDYVADFTVTRVGSNMQSSIGTITSDLGAPDALLANGSVAETDTSDITVAFKSANTAAAAASATGKGMVCSFLN